MISGEANQILANSEKGANAHRGRNFEEALMLLRLRTCPACQYSRRLEFHSPKYDHLCPKCGHSEKPTDARFMTQTLSASKSDALLPIGVAILMSLVFALVVFWIAFGLPAR